MTNVLRHALGLCAVAVSLSLAGCSPPLSRYMRHVENAPPVGAQADAATVVFIRPNRVVWGVVIPIIDENERFYGNLAAESYIVARVPPGRHVFVSWLQYDSSIDAVQADLAPGKVYYVRTEVLDKMFGGRSLMTAIKPGSEEWPRLAGYLAGTKQEEFRPEEEKNVRVMEADRKAGWTLRERIGVENLAKMGEREREAHTLAPGDGDSGR